MNEERKVLSRWSERKAAARRGEAPPDPAKETQAPAATSEQAAPPEVAVSADDEMPALPSIDELTADSDYTVFLGNKVPEQLRRAALRKLWASDPVFANLDGLNDYDEDYNLVTTVVGAVQSAWQAGRGYAEEVEEALGGPAGAQDEPQPDESQAASEPARASQDGGALGESDAGGENSADALRRVAGAEPGAASD
ncbi:MAG: DUF3306 domain-containing protein [Pseudolabrys sp.]